MDRSEVRKIVEANAEKMQEAFGIPHWNIVYTLDNKPTDGDWVSLGLCEPKADYNRAYINLNPDGFENEAQVVKTLRHELFHVLQSPFWLFKDAMWELVDGDPVKARVFNTIWTHAIEQNAINLERMYQGLAEASFNKVPIETTDAEAPQASESTVAVPGAGGEESG